MLGLRHHGYTTPSRSSMCDRRLLAFAESGTARRSPVCADLEPSDAVASLGSAAPLPGSAVGSIALRRASLCVSSSLECRPKYKSFVFNTYELTRLKAPVESILMPDNRSGIAARQLGPLPKRQLNPFKMIFLQQKQQQLLAKKVGGTRPLKHRFKLYE